MHDLLLRGAHLIDPSQGIDRKSDIAFANGVVAEIGERITTPAREVIDLSGAIVTPGLIDLHTHIYWGGTSIGVDPDTVGEQSACTTLVDAGTAGPANILGLEKHIIEPATTRVLAYINASFAGIYAFSQHVMVGECTDIRLLNARVCRDAIRAHRDILVGVKVRVGITASGSNGIAPLDIALEIAEEVGLPVMAHLDNPPPSRREVLERLRPGDVLTHCFRPFPNAPVRNAESIYPEIIAARERGVFFDIGHGMGSFGFATANAMMKNGFYPDVISSDVHSLSIDGPAYDLLTTMSKFLCLGLSLNEVIRATTQTPANAMQRESLGHLRVGEAGDASVIERQDGEFSYRDSLGVEMVGQQRLGARGRVIAGRWLARRD